MRSRKLKIVTIEARQCWKIFFSNALIGLELEFALQKSQRQGQNGRSKKWSGTSGIVQKEVRFSIGCALGGPFRARTVICIDTALFFSETPVQKMNYVLPLFEAIKPRCPNILERLFCVERSPASVSWRRIWLNDGTSLGRAIWVYLRHFRHTNHKMIC